MSVYLLLLLSLVSRSVLAIDCYRPNGDLITDPAYEACNRRNAEDAGGSMCCALNRTSYPDQCLSNGLCGGGGNLFRDGCTDPTWKSPLCLKLCVEGFGGSGTAIGVSQETTLDYSKSDIQITDCNDGTYCCGPDNTTCCRRDEGVRIASILEPPESTTSSTSTSATSTSPTTSITSAAPPSAAGSQNSLGPPKRKIPILAPTLISILGAMVLIALIIWLVRVRRQRRELNEKDPTDIQELSSKDTGLHEKPNEFVRPELWEKEPHVELDSNARRAELAG